MVTKGAFLQPLNHALHQIYRVADRLSFKGGIVHMGAVVSLVGDGSYHQIGDLIEICCLSDGRTLHLCAVSACVLDNLVFHLFFGYKLVAAHHAALKYPDIGIDQTAYLRCQAAQIFICRKRQSVHSGHLTDGIAELPGVHIVLQRVCGEDNITDVDLRPQGAGHAGVDDSIHMEVIRQDLGTDSGIYLADPGAYDHCLLTKREKKGFWSGLKTFSVMVLQNGIRELTFQWI